MVVHLLKAPSTLAAVHTVGKVRIAEQPPQNPTHFCPILTPSTPT